MSLGIRKYLQTEWIHAKQNHIVIFIIVINVLVWGGILLSSLLLPEHKASAIRTPANTIERAEKYRVAPSTAPAINAETTVAAEAPVSGWQSTFDWFFKSWPMIFTILTSIPIVLLKWQKALASIKKGRRR